MILPPWAGLYTNKSSGHGLRWQWPFVYEATGRRGWDLSWQWSLFRLDLDLVGFGLGLVLSDKKDGYRQLNVRQLDSLRV